jgi:dynein heavy chain
LSAVARFYFLSNEELLDILSQVKNPAAVQPHLQKCFDGIRRLEMRQEEHGLEVAAMVSAEGARLGLVKTVKVRSGCRSS